MALVRLIIVLGICVTGFATVECVDCNNEAGYCIFYTSYLRCYITANDTESIKTLLSDCSSNSSVFTGIYVHKNYVSNECGKLTIDIKLPTNIQSLNIYNTQDQDHICLTTFSQNTGLTRIYTTSYIELGSNDFFNHFTALQYINLRYVLSREPPSFTNLLSLTYLEVYLVGPVTHALNDEIVSGLTNLVILSLYNSYFNGISKGAFRNLNKLTNLDLGYNELAYIEDGALRDLSSLEQLYLHNNKIRIVSENLFESLTALTYLYLDNNPGFPPNALLKAKSVIYLFLRYNGYHTLESYVFQQMDSLRYLYLSDPFVCDCKLKWTSLVEQHELYIPSGVCSEIENNHYLRSITSEYFYTNCFQTESFQCFNKSTTCPDNQVCHNTENTYFCGCPRGYALHNSGQCEDVDECDETTDCQQNCQNTEGSFHCTCDEGYKLASDGYSCNDINECHELNGGFEFGYRTTVSLCQCKCHLGLELINITHSDTQIQCDILQNDAGQGYHLACRAGFNLTIKKVTCYNSTEHTIVQVNENQPVETTSEQFQTSMNIFTLLLFIIGLQTVVIILILLCSFRIGKAAKIPKIHQSIHRVHFQENAGIPLKKLIDQQRLSIVPYTIMENSDSMKVNPTYENIK